MTAWIEEIKTNKDKEPVKSIQTKNKSGIK